MTSGLYRAGERPMADVDLLVQQHDIARAASVLESLGFQESDFSFKDRTFTPINNPASAALGEHAGNALKIELHHRIAERLPLRITPLPDVLLPSGSPPGLNAYPSLAALMLHLLLHASGSMAFRSLRILQLHDIALLDARMSSAGLGAASAPTSRRPVCPLGLASARADATLLPAADFQ